jgi:hypothetical protein
MNSSRETLWRIVFQRRPHAAARLDCQADRCESAVRAPKTGHPVGEQLQSAGKSLVAEQNVEVVRPTLADMAPAAADDVFSKLFVVLDQLAFELRHAID